MSPLPEQIRVYTPWFPFVRITLLGVCGLALEVLARRISARMAAKLARSSGTPSDIDRRRRAATLMSFATSVARVVIWVTVLISVLAEVNINIGPILAGAGVIGAALAFGAQNIVKDYLAGFFILLEDQYGLGDVVKIGAVSGTVEDVSMRVTVLRGADGTTHVIPNGTIQTVSNMTSSWARAIVDVTVAHQVRIEDALLAMREVATTMGEDADWKRRMLDAIEVVGIVALNDGSATLRVQVKVVAEEQWRVKNELMARIKAAFDARKIEFPGMGALPVPVKQS